MDHLPPDRRAFLKQSLLLGGAMFLGSRRGALAVEPAAPVTPKAPAVPDLRFPPGFLWGAATSCYQVEGAWDADGKSESIWDRFAHTSGKIAEGANGDVACDQYHRFKEDVAILRRLNLKSYRFSTSWSRIQPAGTGRVNPQGLDYYSRLVDELLAAGIRPFCTIYHWDLPQALEDRGGWPNRDLAGYFADFAGLLAKHLGDRVTVWAPFNMPDTFTYRGYGNGAHPPARANTDDYLRSVHTVALAHGMAHRAIKAASSHATVGSAYGMEPGFPRTNTETDREAVRRFEAIRNRLFFHAALTGEYPDAFVGEIPHEAMGFRSGDEKILKVPFDWLGVHYYCRLAVSAPDQPPAPRGGAKTPDPHGQFRVGLFNEGESTDGGLEIWPTGLYDLLTSLAREVGNLPIEITETGGVYRDGPGSDGAVHDSRRIDWYRQHLIQLHRAIAAGANVRAYHAWSLLDNFEWHSGYTQRYGLTWVDFATQRRIIKDSGLWLSRVARENRLV